ncbi:hydratase [Shewanella sp.]|uniref:hydratase n=2 Tax=Shewanella sp. TaxID=50422 RepID=UPI00405437DB
MMTPSSDLALRRIAGIPGPRLAEADRPDNFIDAFALQQQISQQVCQQALTEVIGWKCLLPVVDNALGDTKYVLAPIFAAETIIESKSSAAISAQCRLFPSAKNMARVEPELAFEFGTALPPQEQEYTNAQIDNAIGGVRLALELIQSRYSKPTEVSYFEALADGLVNQGLYLGPHINYPQEGGLSLVEAFELEVTQGTGTIAQSRCYSAKHPNNNPKAGLYWLVNFLSQQGIGISAGQQVITGSYAGVLDLPLDQEIHFRYGELGQFKLQFKAK